MVFYICIIVNNILFIDICNMLNIKIIIINCYFLDIFEKFFLFFFVYFNVKKIFSICKMLEILIVLNGIWFLSIFWVVFGYMFVFVLLNISMYI